MCLGLVALINFRLDKFTSIRPLFEQILCVPASSAPVERVFSQSGLVMRPNRAQMTNTLLEELVFLKCNAFSLWTVDC